MKIAVVSAALACLVSLPALAGCIVPGNAPRVPDGATASRDGMLSAQLEILKYDSDVREYASCLDRLGGDAVKQGAAVEQLKKIAAQFNTELRVFKKRGGD